jgi:hypothetical protein
MGRGRTRSGEGGRSASLYLIVRVQSNLGWTMGGRGVVWHWWDYVADIIRLGKEEEEALRRKGDDDKDDDDDDNNNDGDDDDYEGGGGGGGGGRGRGGRGKKRKKFV